MELLMTEFKKWRLDNNYSQQDVATALGCHLQTVSNWDTKDKMYYGYREKFIEIYNVDPEDLGFKTDYRQLKK